MGAPRVHAVDLDGAVTGEFHNLGIITEIANALLIPTQAGGGIRHNGDFINPSFVEKTIAEHPAITDVFVYGVPAASGAPGEKDVVATIVFAEGEATDVASVFATCHERLEANFVPTYLQVVDEIPKTASEKPQERFLLQRFDPNGADVYTE